MNNLKTPLLALALFLLLLPAKSQRKDRNELKASAEVLAAFSKIKETIPEAIFNNTKGIVVIPKLKTVGFTVAEKKGKGIAIVKKEDGTWSDPVFVLLDGGSPDIAIEGRTADLVLLFKNSEILTIVYTASFRLGGDVSVTAGRIRSNASHSAGAGIEAEIYAYSKSEGRFTGLGLNGTSLYLDSKRNARFYGKKVDWKAVARTGTKNCASETQFVRQAVAGAFQ